VVGAYYYIRVVKVMYFDEPKEVFDQPMGRELSIIVAATAVFNVLFCLLPSPLLNQAKAAAAALLS
jgi:NADH-quinone oxidoreductase subunit N